MAEIIRDASTPLCSNQRMKRRILHALALLIGFLLLAPSVRAQSPDWNAVAAEDVIVVLTHDVDGELRETTVWMGALDGVGYVRTSDTRWRANILRDPNVGVRVAGNEYPLRAELATDDALHARVNAVFRAKYGFTDRMLGWLGNEGGKYCLALLPRLESP
jgi:hypothetical protein